MNHPGPGSDLQQSSAPRAGRSRLRTYFRRAFRISAIFSMLFAAGLGVLWKQGALEPWLRARVIETYLRTVAPRLPFTIEKIETTQTWNELLNGHVDRLALALRTGAWRIRLSGPVQITRLKETRLSIKYDPKATFEPVQSTSLTNSADQRSPEIDVSLSAIVSAKLTGIDEFVAHASAGSFQWKLYGIALEKPLLDLNWKDKALAVQAEVATAAWESGDKSVRTEALNFQLKAPLSLEPFAIGEISFDLNSGKSLEVLWGERYVDFPLQQLPLSGLLILNSSQQPQKLSLEVGPQAQRVHLGAEFRYAAQTSAPTGAEITWKTPRLKFPELFKAAVSAAPVDSAPVQDILLSGGTLQTEGKLKLPLPFTSASNLALAKGTSFRLTDVSFSIPRLNLAARGLDLVLPLSGSFAITEGGLSIERVSYRRFQAQLSRTRISLEKRNPGYALQIGNGGQLPLKTEGIPLRVGSISGTLASESGAPLSYDLQTSIELGTLEITKAARLLCLPLPRFPRTRLSAHLPRVEISSDMIQPIGTIRADLLGGTVEVNEMGMFDLLTGVPELDFNAELKGIRLDTLGEWLGFGEMDGVINAYAHDVTFQSWLPTRYDFGVEVKPLHRWKVVFSPDAMKNFVRLFAGEDIDNLPGVADWLAFGWPSRVLGGYDVLYAGISAHSEDAILTLKTLDPPEIVKRHRKHFILYGPRFKMPLQSPEYPLIIDATSMSNYLRRMALQLGKMKSEKKKQTEESPNEADENSCVPEN